MTVDEALELAGRASDGAADYARTQSDASRVLAAEVRRLREECVKLCESAREKERASVVRYLRARARVGKHAGSVATLLILADDIEAGEHVRDDLGGDHDRG